MSYPILVSTKQIRSVHRFTNEKGFMGSSDSDSKFRMAIYYSGLNEPDHFYYKTEDSMNEDYSFLKDAMRPESLLGSVRLSRYNS